MAWKTRFVTAILLLLVFQDVAEATPSWYKSWRWWFGEFAIAGSTVALAHSTVYRTSLCGDCGPSITKIKTASGIAFGIETVLHASGHHVLSDDDSHAWQVISDVGIPALVVAFFVPSTVHNYNFSFDRQAAKSAFLPPGPRQLKADCVLILSGKSWSGPKTERNWVPRGFRVQPTGGQLWDQLFHCAPPTTNEFEWLSQNEVPRYTIRRAPSCEPAGAADARQASERITRR
jgi:hypothetical protein